MLQLMVTLATPNNALQPTRGRPTGGRSPLSFETLGAAEKGPGRASGLSQSRAPQEALAYPPSSLAARARPHRLAASPGTLRTRRQGSKVVSGP